MATDLRREVSVSFQTLSAESWRCYRHRRPRKLQHRLTLAIRRNGPLVTSPRRSWNGPEARAGLKHVTCRWTTLTSAVRISRVPKTFWAGGPRSESMRVLGLPSNTSRKWEPSRKLQAGFSRDSRHRRRRLYRQSCCEGTEGCRVCSAHLR